MNYPSGDRDIRSPGDFDQNTVITRNTAEERYCVYVENDCEFTP